MTKPPEYESEPKTNLWRVAFAIMYGVIGLGMILFLRGELFYLQAPDDFSNFCRFLWCIACSCIGFAVLAFHVRQKSKSPFPSYLTWYPLFLIAISSLVFAGCHLSEKSSGYLFYFISGPLCFILAYLVDSFLHLFVSLANWAGRRKE